MIPNGYCNVIPYTNTIEGTEVTYVCWTINHTQHQPACKQRNVTAVCTAEGIWEPNFQKFNICDLNESSGTLLYDCHSDYYYNSAAGQLVHNVIFYRY